MEQEAPSEHSVRKVLAVLLAAFEQDHLVKNLPLSNLEPNLDRHQHLAVEPTRLQRTSFYADAILV